MTVMFHQDGETALHQAALEDHVEVVRTLVDHGAAVDIRNQVVFRYTLQVGCIHSYVHVAYFL